MASASPCVNLLKAGLLLSGSSSGYDLYDFGNLPNTPLAEVVDHKGRVLCLLPPVTILEQRLPHKSLAVLLIDNQGRKLLSRNPQRGFGFTAADILYAGNSVEEQCAAMFEPREIGDLALIGVHPPCQENGHAFTHIFQARDHGEESMDLLAVDRGEFNALLAYGYEIEPFFKSLVLSGWLPWQ